MHITDYLSDFNWRIRNLYMITNDRGQPEPFRLRPAQERLLKNMRWLNEILKARQLGFSTLIALFILDRLIWNDHQTAGVIDSRLPDAKKKLAKMSFAWSHIGEAVPGLTGDERTAFKEFIHKTRPIKTNGAEFMEWQHGSRVDVGTTFRGGTLNVAHVSEYGEIALRRPQAADDIWTGMLPALTDRQPVFFESTHRGGKFGRNYELIQMAMENEAKSPAELTARDWKFHFEGWQEDPKYIVDLEQTRTPFGETHFAECEADGIFLSLQQKNFWEMMRKQYKSDVGAEYPTRPRDAIEAPIEGAIFGGWITDLRALGSVGVDFPIDQRPPAWCSWDLGQSDYTAAWCIQPVGDRFLVLDFHENQGMPVSYYAKIVRDWRNRYPLAGHFFPHDAGNRVMTGGTYAEHARQAGMENVTVLKRCSDIWAGINEIREILPRFIFHKRVATRTVIGGEEHPCGVDHLESYRKRLAAPGEHIPEQPIHDEHSHAADALRYFGEAWRAGLVARTMPEKRPANRQIQVIM